MTAENISPLDPWHGVNDVPVWTLGDRMRKALRHSDFGVNDMAADLGVSTATIGRWLSDRGPVKRQTLKVWALTTGVDLEWLETGVPSDEAGLLQRKNGDPEGSPSAARPKGFEPLTF